MSESDETEEGPVSAAPKRRRRRAAPPGGQIDIRATLEAPVRVKQDGKSTSLDPYEAMLRQHAKKAVVDRNLPAIKLVLEEAEKNALITPPTPHRRGGVFVVPKDLPAEIQERHFSDDDYTAQSPSTIVAIVMAVYDVLGLDRLVRCFNGDRE